MDSSRLQEGESWSRPPSRQGRAHPVVVKKLCCCERPNSTIMCRYCGYFNNNARVARVCPVHPRTSYLSDMKLCPACHTNGLLEFAKNQ